MCGGAPKPQPPPRVAPPPMAPPELQLTPESAASTGTRRTSRAKTRGRTSLVTAGLRVPTGETGKVTRNTLTMKNS